MRTVVILGFCAALGWACSSQPQREVPGSNSKQRVLDALTKTSGKERALETYRAWMADARKYTPDDETAHLQILAALERMQKLAAGMKQHADQIKGRLLHETDHRAVLTASRELIRTRQEYAHDPAIHPGPRPEMSHIAGDDPKLPSVLRDLGAPRIMVLDDCVVIEFGGGFHHQGLMALATDGETVMSDQKGRLRLIDGLWFYEDTD